MNRIDSRLNQSPTGAISLTAMNADHPSPTDLGRNRHCHDLGHVAGAVDGS
ncbi:hypothetical protein KKD81_00045 [Patescibacteria group bacterium]|nr:hypothetical protein [Patescibacteria group bacterium]MBU2158651.1 hypothetical protein [Patescibacteria group bacterium]MBU2220312.1 hypothetical protein [Patescibacteria group bacterium]